jgi:hypothetical protein
MSTPTIFFVATGGEALTMDLPGDLKGKPTVRSKNITPDIIGDLDFLLTGERTREPTCLRDNDNVAVFRLDDELVNALANVEDEQVAAVADEWGLYDFADALVFLNELRALADEAQARDEELFFYF